MLPCQKNVLLKLEPGFSIKCYLQRIHSKYWEISADIPQICFSLASIVIKIGLDKNIQIWRGSYMKAIS